MAAKKPTLYVGGGIMLADATAELREFVDHLQIPVAHTIMGKGALPDDHPFVLGMTGFWGTKFINEQCRGADWILGLGTRFSEADCSSWEPEYTFNFPPTKLIHIDIDPAEIGRNFPVEIGAVADLKEALIVLNRVARKLAPAGVKRPELASAIAAARASFVAGNKAHATSNAYPMRPERILADVREVLPRDALITTDVGWNKNGVGQQFPILEAGTIFTPGGYATMGFGAPAALGREDRPARSRGRRPGRRRRVRPEPGAARHRVRGRRRRRVGGHEQLRVRHDRRPREGALRDDVRHRVREERQALLARLCGDREGVWRRRRQDRCSRASSSRHSKWRSSPASRS